MLSPNCLPPTINHPTQYSPPDAPHPLTLSHDHHHHNITQESKAVAYYCRAYAMDQAMLLRDQSNQKEVMPYLLALMDKLEVDKKGMPPVAEGKALVKAFADRVFTKADEEDQIGAADKNTARTFYAAGVFYDVMQQFRAVPGEGGEAEQEAERELERRRKYCKWKAADILNAIKEGAWRTGMGMSGWGGDVGGWVGVCSLSHSYISPLHTPSTPPQNKQPTKTRPHAHSGRLRGQRHAGGGRGRGGPARHGGGEAACLGLGLGLRGGVVGALFGLLGGFGFWDV